MICLNKMTFKPLTQVSSWEPPSDWRRITTIDAHTEGEPFRVITGGFPELPGETMLARRRFAKSHYDDLRTALMWEPRGHVDMYGCIVTPSRNSRSRCWRPLHSQRRFQHDAYYGVIGFTTVALEIAAYA